MIDPRNGSDPLGVREPAPITAQKLELGSALIHYQSLPEGGMELVFTPAVPIPGTEHWQFVGVQVRIPFAAEAWERFKRDVGNDGVVSRVAIAKQLPPEQPSQ